MKKAKKGFLNSHLKTARIISFGKFNHGARNYISP